MREQMHVRIVPMTGDHLDEVAELERICFTTPWSRNMLVEELQNDCAAFLVALDDEDHVGVNFFSNKHTTVFRTLQNFFRTRTA